MRLIDGGDQKCSAIYSGRRVVVIGGFRNGTSSRTMVIDLQDRIKVRLDGIKSRKKGSINQINEKNTIGKMTPYAVITCVIGSCRLSRLTLAGWKVELACRT
jgi:hypothetical protein